MQSGDASFLGHLTFRQIPNRKILQTPLVAALEPAAAVVDGEEDSMPGRYLWYSWVAVVDVAAARTKIPRLLLLMAYRHKHPNRKKTHMNLLTGTVDAMQHHRLHLLLREDSC